MTSRRNPCTDARRTETTCVTPTSVAPRHVDASRNFSFLFFLFFSERAARGGGGGALPDFFIFIFFPVQQTTSGIGHRVKQFSTLSKGKRVKIPAPGRGYWNGLELE